jgi:molybdopterin synthase sulfur carrier subunit
LTTGAPVQVTLKLFASLADHLPDEARRAHRLLLELPAGTTIADVIERRNLPPKLCHLVLVNGVFVAPAQRASHVLRQDDELAIWPPVAGG